MMLTDGSLINQRCKGQQHMRWSREGLDPLLQLRAAIGSNDWDKIWKTAVMNEVVKQWGLNSAT